MQKSIDHKGDIFKVEGGNKLHGEVSLSGGKNTVLPLICATLLTSDPCTLKNVPKISDVRNLGKILKLLGSEIEYKKKDSGSRSRSKGRRKEKSRDDIRITEI